MVNDVEHRLDRLSTTRKTFLLLLVDQRVLYLTFKRILFYHKEWLWNRMHVHSVCYESSNFFVIVTIYPLTKASCFEDVRPLSVIRYERRCVLPAVLPFRVVLPYWRFGECLLTDFVFFVVVVLKCVIFYFLFLLMKTPSVGNAGANDTRKKK